MLIINNNQQRLLLDYLSDAQQYIESDDIDGLLEILDAKITEVGFNDNYELNSHGFKLQQLYDSLYDQN